MTPNSVTPYYLCFIDLSKGPFVVDLPPGVRGGVIDGWQYNLDDTAKSAKYLLIGPGQATPADIAGGTVFAAFIRSSIASSACICCLTLAISP